MKTTKSTKVFALEHFAIYGNQTDIPITKRSRDITNYQEVAYKDQTGVMSLTFCIGKVYGRLAVHLVDADLENSV